MHASFAANKRRYGSPRIHRDLIEQQEHVSRKHVIRLMQEEGLTARVRKRFTCTTMSVVRYCHGDVGALELLY